MANAEKGKAPRPITIDDLKGLSQLFAVALSRAEDAIASVEALRFLLENAELLQPGQFDRVFARMSARQRQKMQKALKKAEENAQSEALRQWLVSARATIQ